MESSCSSSSSSSSLLSGTKTCHQFDLKNVNIKEAKVYFDRVELTREFEVDSLDVGEHTIVIIDKSLEFEQKTLKLTGKGSVTVLETRVLDKTEEIKNDVEHRVKLESELNDVRHQLVKLEQRLQRCNESRHFIEQFAHNISSVGNSTSLKADTLVCKDTISNVTSFLKNYESQLEKMDVEFSEVKKEIKSLKKNEMKLLEKLKNEKPETSIEKWRELHILVHAPQAGKAIFTLTYQNVKSGWEAFYDIRVDSEKETCELLYFANVKQSLSQPWKNIKLYLSTVPTNEKSSPPKLNPIVLGYENVNNYATKSSKRKFFGETFAFGLEAEGMVLEDKMSIPPLRSLAASSSLAPAPPPAPVPAPAPREMEVKTTTSKQGATSSIFEIEQPTSISNNNQAHKVTIAVIKFDKSKFEYYSVPKLSDKVFLKVSLTNSEAFPLISGNLNVFMDGTFVTTSKLNQINSGEEFQSFLATDEGIKVEYKPPQQFRKAVGLTRGTSCLSVSKLIKVKNSKSTSIDLIIKDHVPRITDGRIGVNILEPNGLDMNEKNELKNFKIPQAKSHICAEKISIDIYGTVEWKLKIAEGEKIEIPLKYELNYPASHNVYEFL